MTKFDVVAALSLRGMKVLSSKRDVVRIDNPSQDFKKQAFNISECIGGQRRNTRAIRFNGFCICWNEE
ncbi:hypothetical protein [Shewanella algae]|uniref:hypothetical protein n=1 Tax=Shewanella algae TaxID=38313 RepID=UPI0031F5B205